MFLARRDAGLFPAEAEGGAHDAGIRAGVFVEQRYVDLVPDLVGKPAVSPPAGRDGAAESEGEEGECVYAERILETGFVGEALVPSFVGLVYGETSVGEGAVGVLV